MISGLKSSLPKTMAGDRWRFRRELSRLTHNLSRKKGKAGPSVRDRLSEIEKKIGASIQKKARRRKNRPRPEFFQELPITEKKKEIIEAIRNHSVVIISGETGSGKTTQIPKFCIAAGRGIDGKIGCTQPRRIAATTVARRIADELGETLGRSVGFKIRFKDRTDPDAYIKVMTDGILLAEAQSDRYLNAYDTLIVDEAHERSLNIDFILGILKKLVQRRRNLKVIITSATIDTEKFSKAFNNAPIIEVSGRMYPVKVRYAGTDDNGDANYVEQAVRSVDRLLADSRNGDILVFMPTERDIREACEMIDGRNHRHVTVLPLYARLSASDQSRVFKRISRRKIVVATNVAETSITLPGIRYVVDTGLARIAAYSPRTRITSLPVTGVSKSSADQRKGRCGRVAKGICIRLFTEDDYENRPRFTPPEILRTNLAEVILRMISLKLGRISEFPFIDRPAEKSIQDGYQLLKELGAIKRAKGKKKRRVSETERGQPEYVLTRKGRLMANLPIDPRLSGMLIESGAQGCMEEVAVIASALSIRDPRERPVEKAEKADMAHREFADPASDFSTLLNIWRRYLEVIEKEKTAGGIKRFCKTGFLSYLRMREWRDIHFQITGMLKEAGVWKTGSKPGKTPGGKMKADNTEFSGPYTAIHKSILAGFLSNIATRKNKFLYNAANGKEVMLFPGSAVFKTAGQWVVSAEMVETSRLFARTVATIDCGWIEALAGNLCRYTWMDPHWERKRGEVVAKEQVTLFGLIINPGRPVSYGRIDPAKATELFIQSALIQGDVADPMRFMIHNRRLIEEVEAVEHKIRRRDVLVEEADLFEFYRHRLPDVYDIRTLKSRIRKKGGDHFLKMRPEDLWRYHPDPVTLDRFPDKITLGDQRFSCRYHFKPGQPEDGITVRIPQHQAAAVPPDAMDWLVPGLYREKITALIKGLPKSYRKRLVPLSDTVRTVVEKMPQNEGSLINALGQFIHDRFGLDIPASAWPEQVLPEHLKTRISITNAAGKEIRSGRDRSILLEAADSSTADREIEQAKRRWEKVGLREWDFDEIPEIIHVQLKNGRKIPLFPALAKSDADDGTVCLKLHEDQRTAAASHPKGVAALFEHQLSGEMKFLKKSLALPPALNRATGDFGGHRKLVNLIYQWIIGERFEKEIRTKAAFDAHADKNGPLLIKEGQKLLSAVVPLIESYHRTGKALFDLETRYRFNAAACEILARLKEAMALLVPANFLSLYHRDRLVHLPRYIKAIEIRAERAVVDVEKDRVKEAEVTGFEKQLKKLLGGLTPASSAEKREAVESFYWMIEEYKVSLFAQELKTAIRISKKRLEKMQAEIDRMI